MYHEGILGFLVSMFWLIVTIVIISFVVHWVLADPGGHGALIGNGIQGIVQFFASIFSGAIG